MTPTPEARERVAELRKALADALMPIHRNCAGVHRDKADRLVVDRDLCDCGAKNDDALLDELMLVAEIVGVIEAKHRNAITRPRKDALNEVLTYLHGLAPETTDE